MAIKKLILDLDTGIDDALALAYALSQKKADLIGVIASYGNTQVEIAAQNTLDLLSLLGHKDIPVYIGERKSLEAKSFETMEVSKQIHGQNGIGDIKIEKSTQSVQTKNGVDFLIDSANEYAENLILVPTGPLTNLAKAFKKDPAAIKKIGNTTFMGGALTVPGNVTSFSEANINQDPLAADIVCKNIPNLTMVGLDVTLRTLLTYKESRQWRNIGSKAAILYAEMLDYYIKAYYDLDIDKQGAAIHDPLAVGLAIDPSYATYISLALKTVYDHTKDYGRIIGDEKKLRLPTDTKAAVNVNAPRFTKHFMDRIDEILAHA
ncbi:nucleoside hydrolase [Oenococcus alcoholitolerans]|uniref:Inosine-uridine nucleoside N-ribohydrolase n=1 Tax=Oenococcus alcoholitolerans TaxID=931074 RepID=A0ABR4XQ53_9LACO|nr:inosine-uridine nucleoside N-ribohydrolase [Oenococcus alcoholitolerans]